MNDYKKRIIEVLDNLRVREVLRVTHNKSGDITNTYHFFDKLKVIDDAEIDFIKNCLRALE